jgi:hypothetical protein
MKIMGSRMHTLGISNRLFSISLLMLPTVGLRASGSNLHVCDEEQHNNDCIPITDAESEIFLHACYKGKTQVGTIDKRNRVHDSQNRKKSPVNAATVRRIYQLQLAIILGSSKKFQVSLFSLT